MRVFRAPLSVTMFEETDNNQENEHNNQSPGTWDHCLSFLLCVGATSPVQSRRLITFRCFYFTQLFKRVPKLIGRPSWLGAFCHRFAYFLHFLQSPNAIRALLPREGCLDLQVYVCIHLGLYWLAAVRGVKGIRKEMRINLEELINSACLTLQSSVVDLDPPQEGCYK